MYEISPAAHTDSIAHSVRFRKVPGDAIQVQMYTLRNGLRLFLSVQKDEPRVYTEIAVRAGSKHDPAETTGLAHYFEHMMFKGTDRMGSLDWPREKQLLDQIEQTYEQHRTETNPLKKKELYGEIDRLSFEAAKLAATNEYHKLVSNIGANGTNAYTWVEQTVYVNDIPANELERWFELESERFRRPILRLFHTELETVFEEYNMNQDKDFRKTLKVMQAALTPSHPYGTQTTLGRGEDLKNPSQTNIYRFFDTYYVPNNMAIVMAGDFDPQEAVRLAEHYFGGYRSKPVPKFKFEPQAPLSSRIQHHVYGHESPWLEMGWRVGGAKSEEAMLLPLVAGMLHNYQAGIFDLNIIQQQRVLEAYAYPRVYEDYSNLQLIAKPREGQSLEALEAILLAEVAKLRNGDFEDWLPAAVLKDLKLAEIKSFEKNQGRASALTTAFVSGLEWSEVVRRWKKLERITKADIVAFAKQYIRDDNFVVVYKHTGDDPSVMKVEKPAITPIEVNRDGQSAFATEFLKKKSPDLIPQFIDFKRVIKTSSITPKIKLRSVQEKKSKIFRLHYCFDMGKNADPRLNLLAGYLPFLGTSRYSGPEMQQAFFRLGLHFSATCEGDRFFLSLSGLEESFAEGVALLDHLVADAQPNAAALQNLVADTLLRRDNNKKDKRSILTKGMVSYAKYGPISPFTDKLSAEQLLALKPAELTELLQGILRYKHEIFYCGAKTARTVSGILKQQNLENRGILPVLKPKTYPELATRKDRVLFVHFPIVQVELMLLSKGTTQFNLDEFVMSGWYNQYFGYGLSSIVFQEIRESKALAYSAYVQAVNPQRKQKSHWLEGAVSTQPDKLHDAIAAFQHILENMPVSVVQMENARQSIIRQIAASRINKADLYWSARLNQMRGYPNHDLREDVYQTLQAATPETLKAYQEKYIKGRHFTWLILGDRERVDFKYLRSIGKVEELTLEEVFGY
jgi:predicted Zn-dependent peptidase